MFLNKFKRRSHLPAAEYQTVRARHRLRRFRVAWLLALGCLVPVHAAEVVKLSAHGLEIEVRELKRKVGPAWRFDLRLKNVAKGSRGFEGRLTLLAGDAAEGKSEPRVLRQCPVFWTVPAGETQNISTSCTSGPYAAWTFVIVKVKDENGKELR